MLYTSPQQKRCVTFEIRATIPLRVRAKKNAPIPIRIIDHTEAGARIIDNAAIAETMVPIMPTIRQVLLAHSANANTREPETAAASMVTVRIMSARTAKPKAIHTAVVIAAI